MRESMAEAELERRSKYLSSLIQRTRIEAGKEMRRDEGDEKGAKPTANSAATGDRCVRVRAADMAPEMQSRAFRCAGEALAAMPKLESKRLALALKKEFDTSYGPAWHCIVGMSFGSYVTHSLGGFLYFSIDKLCILLFRTAVEPLDC